MMTGSGGVKRIIAAEFHYYPTDENKFSTYPLITSEEAWNQLRDGKGYIANYNSDISEVIIRKIYLAYYDAGQYVEFYQPVMVFEGDTIMYIRSNCRMKSWHGQAFCLVAILSIVML